jgi:hypothetical protein
MISYKKLGVIRIAEFHFDEDAVPARADVIRSLWRSVAPSATQCEHAHTLVLDLGSPPQILLANMHNETRYQIRRAEKDNFQYHFWCGGEPEVVEQFCGFYDGFAASKRLVAANRQRLRALAQIGVLDLSRVSDDAGRVLVWHAHHRAAGRARLIHSASLLGQATIPALRTLIGRANCYHTWLDILRFQQQGLTVYDLGGWYGGSDDQAKLHINKFKERFGGIVVPEFNSEAPATTAGRLALDSKSLLLSILARSRSWLPIHKAPHRTAQPHTSK